MPPKKDGKRPTRAGRNKKEEEEPVDTVPPPSEKEVILKEEYVHIVFSYYVLTLFSVFTR